MSAYYFGSIMSTDSYNSVKKAVCVQQIVSGEYFLFIFPSIFFFLESTTATSTTKSPSKGKNCKMNALFFASQSELSFIFIAVSR